MPKMTMHAAIVAALTARGETKVKALASCDVYTRTFGAERNRRGELVAAKEGTAPFFFVGPSGSLRSGSKKGSSRPIANPLKLAIMKEGGYS